AQAAADPFGERAQASDRAPGRPRHADEETTVQRSAVQPSVTAVVGDAERARPAAAVVGLTDHGQGRHRGRAEDDRAGVQLPGQRASAPESPVSGTQMPETLAPWGTGPQRPPWESEPPSHSTGPQQRHPWDSGPQRPVTRTDSQPASRTGPHPVSRTGEQPTRGTGPQPAQETETPPAERPPWDSDERRLVERAPWDSGGWDDRPGHPSGGRDTSNGAPEPEPVPTAGSDASMTATRPARQERGAHRAAKHGRPSRWRGNRSTEGEP
ncbi:MAG: hypothetical protein ACRDNS_02585, partial [Trebonia sp.]